MVRPSPSHAKTVNDMVGGVTSASMLKEPLYEHGTTPSGTFKVALGGQLEELGLDLVLPQLNLG